MMTPFPMGELDENVHFETVLLERLKFYASQSFDPSMLETMSHVVTTADGIARQMILEMRAEIWSEKLPPATYKTERVVDCMHYATWVDHLISTIDNSRRVAAGLHPAKSRADLGERFETGRPEAWCA